MLLQQCQVWGPASSDLPKKMRPHRKELILLEIFFSIEMNIYTIKIKTTVIWHHDYYGCQGYKKVIIKGIKFKDFKNCKTVAI